MTSNRPSDDTRAPSARSPRSAHPRSRSNWLLLAAIVLLGGWFGTLNLFGWDGGTGQHPDERFMTDVASRLHVPASLGEYLDSQRNPLNPRNVDKTFYVYGLLPQTLTHIVAVGLTPNAALPPLVPAPAPQGYGRGPAIPNPDLRVPKIEPLQRLLNPSGKDLTNYFEVYKVGRAWSALFALLSVVVVFLIGRRLYGERAGLLAALLLALSVLPIQIAHFFTVDSATAFFTLLTIYWTVRLAQNGGLGSATALGLSIGAAMACRVTMATLGALAVVAVAQRLWLSPPPAPERDEPLSSADSVYFSPPRRALNVYSGMAFVALAGALALLTFRMLQPDAFVGRSFFDLRPEPRFIDNIREIGAMVSGQADAPPSQQWAGRTPFVFSLQNMIIWGMGPLLGLAAWGAWAIAGLLLARAAWDGWNGRGWDALRRRAVHIIPWLWVGFYMAWQGGQFVMTMRYYLQLYGLLALFAAWGLFRIVDLRLQIADWLRRKFAVNNLQSAIVWAPLLLVVAGTLCWAYAFTRIYAQPHSRIIASRWIYEHIPAGAVLSAEQWDDSLPLSIDGRRAFDPQSGGSYYSVQTQPYAEDDPTKYTGYTSADGQYNPGLFDQLDQLDYIILSSNRVYGSATRLPMRYPALTRYYHYLFDGELGFEQVADITSYPTLFGIQIPDQGAEEAFSVYDHPRVLIFKKTAAYTRANAERLIAGDMAWDEVYKLPTPRGSRVPTALRLTDAQWPSFRDAGTWAALFSLASQLPWLNWLLAIELLGLAMFPLLFRIMPRAPDRGFALAKTLGLLLVAYAAWLLGSLRLLAFGPSSVWLCAGLLALAGGAVAWRGRAELRAYLRQRGRALIAAEALFLLAYFGFLLIRALNPDLWHPARGGEKPMDLTFLTAVVKSPYFPPYDPWFAGGYINYYYFGFVIVGALVQLTGIAPTTAYNLAVPALFALTALGAWGVGYNLTGARPEALADEHADAPVRRRERRAIITGLVAAAFVVLLSPLTQALWYLPGSASPPSPDLPPECQVSTYAAQQLCRGRNEWAFWDASRLVGMDLQDSTINEFPFFTFLFADLHAHMIALPLALAALGLMVSLVTLSDQRRAARSALPPLVACLFLLALVVGALRATNTWDFPAYLGLSLGTLALIAWRRVQQGERLPQAALGWLLSALVVAVGSILLFAPFLRSFATDYAGFSIWTGARTPAADFLKINGLWLFLLWSGALWFYRSRGMALARLWTLGIGGPLLVGVVLALRLNALLLLVPIAGVAIGALVDLLLEAGQPVDEGTPARVTDLRLSNPYVQLTLPLDDLEPPAPPAALAVPDGTRRFTSLAALLPIAWALAAVLLSLATELIVAKGDIGRMNTVFKLGLESWVLFALASAVGLCAAWPGLGERTSASRIWGWAWRGAAALLMVGALVYPITATPARLADRIDSSLGPGLDGIAFMRSGRANWGENNQQFDFGEDSAALDWLRANVAGTPIVLEAHTEAYRWGSRVSIYTGLPTLLGWPWHETQQRAAADASPVLNSRQALIQQLYGGDDAGAALRQLQLYGVEYVYVGKLERALYPAAGLAKFDALAQSHQIQQVYAAGDTRIYEVPRASSAPVVLSTTLNTTPPKLPSDDPTRLSVPVDQLAPVREYAWNRLADAQPVAVLLWLLACYALLALGLPPALLAFGRGGAGAYAWARLIGLLLLGYAVWLPVSMGLWAYNRWGLLWGTLIVLALDAALLARLGREIENEELRIENEPSERPSQFYILNSQFRRSFAALRDHFREHRGGILLIEGLFLAAFAFMAALRAFNPDLWQPFWGGEKPFEFGFLNAILRSPVLPPYDPFFSDGKINYYYYGLFLASLPIKATGISPAVGFNLVVPTLFATTLAGACALVARLAGRLRYGLAGAAFVALLGNLAAAFPVGSGQGLKPAADALQLGLSGFGARLDAWFVGPSRVIEIPDRLLTINEFPFWSYLFADLHPHLIAMPITLLVIALALELFDDRRLTTDDRLPSGGQWSAVGGRSGLAALALGALAVTNSWDFPTYALLVAGALAGRAWLAPARTGWRRAGGLAGGLAWAGAIALGGLLLYLPFFQNFQRPAGVTGIGVVRDGSPFGQFVLIYGLYLLILGMWVFAVALRLWSGALAGGRLAARSAGGAREGSEALGIVARPPAAAGATLRMAGWVMLALALIAMVAQPRLAAQAWASPALLKIGLLILLAAGVPALLTRRLPARVWFTIWLAALSWAVALGVELVYIRDHLDGGQAYRMNTVFKFGLQSWILMAVAAAAALPWLARGMRRAGAAARTLGWALVIALTGLALVFPLVGIPSRLAYRFPATPGATLDGLAFMDRAVYDWNGTQIALRDDGDAIRWLNDNIRGTPIVLQSSMEFYRAYGVRVAANTGLPTVVSPLHASEQHDPEQVAARDRDVQEIYSTLDSATALELLSRYHVGYVYVGPIERAAYGLGGMAKFDQLLGSYLTLAYQNASVKIYKVSPITYGFNSGAGAPPPAEPQPRPQPAEPAAQPVRPADEPAIQPTDQIALADLEKQVAANPSAPGTAFELAQRYRDLKRFDDAAAVLQPAARANPNDVGLHHLWGDILSDAGRRDEAEAAYREAIAVSPTAGNYNKLGVELAKWGKLDQAIEAFNQAVAADANLPEPYYHLGEAYEQRGETDKAIDQYRAYLTIAAPGAPYYQDATEAMNRLKK